MNEWLNEWMNEWLKESNKKEYLINDQKKRKRNVCMQALTSFFS